MFPRNGKLELKAVGDTSFTTMHYCAFLCENLTERDNWGHTVVDGRIILRWIFRHWDIGLWNRSSCHRIGTGGGDL
jgi:hypothetical protein